MNEPPNKPIGYPSIKNGDAVITMVQKPRTVTPSSQATVSKGG